MTIQINTKVDSITWPLNQRLTNQQIISQLELTVTENGEILPNDSISINKKGVNSTQAGVYPVIITAVDPNGQFATKKIQAWVTDKNTINSSDFSPQPTQESTPIQHTASSQQPKKKKGKKVVYIVLGVLVLLIAIVFGISACQAHNDTVQNEQAQSNALNNTNSKLDNLSEQNKQLMQQNQELKSAINNYKQNQDKDELQSQLNQIKSENEQLKNNAANNQDLQNQINQLGSTIDQIKQNPNQAESLLNEMKNNQNAFIQNLNNAFQKLVSDFQQLIGK